MTAELRSRFVRALALRDRNRCFELAESLASAGRDAARAGLCALSEALFGPESDASTASLPWLAELIARVGALAQERDPDARGDRIAVGTVVGDGFESVQALVVQLARCEGFEVADLGVGISPAAFAGAVRAGRPVALAILCLSPVCAGNAAVVIDELERQSLRDATRVLLVGPALDAAFATACEADAHAVDPVQAVARLRDWARREGSDEASIPRSKRSGSA